VTTESRRSQSSGAEEEMMKREIGISLRKSAAIAIAAGLMIFAQPAAAQSAKNCRA